jgi:hypothetical protein
MAMANWLVAFGLDVDNFLRCRSSGLKARCVLAEAVFEPARVGRHIEARSFLRGVPEPIRNVELADSEQQRRNRGPPPRLRLIGFAGLN